MTSEHRKKRLNVVIEANIDARTASYVLDKIAQFAHDYFAKVLKINPSEFTLKIKRE